MENEIPKEHITNNKAVRQTLIQHGIRPESLQPAGEIRKVERRITFQEKKELKSPDRLAGNDG